MIVLLDLLVDFGVDVVYIVMFYFNYGEYICVVLEVGKLVFCEKLLVISQVEGWVFVELVCEKGVFLMEVLWMCFLLVYDFVGCWLCEGVVGELCVMQLSFCFVLVYDFQYCQWNLVLVGGVLWDIGIYNLVVMCWVLQQMNDGVCFEFVLMDVEVKIVLIGVDVVVNVMLYFFDGVMLQFCCGFDVVLINVFEVLGSKVGFCFVQDFWQVEVVELVMCKLLVQWVDIFFIVNGFEGEIVEVQVCICVGLLESLCMFYVEMLVLFGWMDVIWVCFFGGVNQMLFVVFCF